MTYDHAPWTLAELTERVAAALAVGYRGQRSGRVREVPDQRAIRWYTTLGLVDRPAAMRGRTALYGRRHLLQLVAIKRLQAAGRSLAEVQVELAAASDERLERIARLPEEAAAAAPPDQVAPPPSALGMGPATPQGARRARFWAAGPASADELPPAAGPQPPADQPQPPPDQPEVAQLQAVQLGDGVTLLLGAARPLDAGDLGALRTAAGPLLAALRARGLDRPDSPRRELP
jgi:DNA-binding transcriptional MerR regulator